MKKLALLLLALCAAVFASPGRADATDVSDEAGLISRINVGETINLLNDITLNQTLCIEKSVTINGNGHTLSLASGKTGSVISCDQDTGTIAINDLTITGGNTGTLGNGAKLGGGGILIKKGTVEVTNCVIKGNTAAGNGGGISVEIGASKPTITNCRFENNTATDDGGGLHCNNVNIEIDRCTFTDNKVTGENGRGGGAYVYPNGSALIKNCTFANNTSAAKGGGLYIIPYAGTISVNYCTFANNTATKDGAAIYYSQSGSEKLTITNSIIHGSVGNVTPSAECLVLTTAPTSAQVSDKTGKVTHTVFRNYTELSAAIDNGNDTSVTVDQLGNAVTTKHDIGAVEIHKHDFTYSASGATLTATCNRADFCDLEENKATLTIKAPTSLEYDGKAKTATVSGEIPGVVTTPAIIYTQSSTPLGGAPVNAGNYVASIALGDSVARVSFTITKKSATVTANPQTVKEGGSIVQGTGQVTTSGLLSGHTLSAVTLTASSTASATTSGTITPGSATIKDGSGNDVTANYAITYEKGTLTVESGSSGGGETTPIDPNDPNITGVKLSITTDTPVVTLTPGETKKLNFTATATVTYKNGSTKSETARIKTWWRGDGAWPDWMKIHSSFSANPNTVDLTPGKDVGGTTMTCRVAAETESYNGHTDWAECEFTVTVQASETFTPDKLLFDKASVELVTEPGGTAEDSVNVMLQLKGSKGTIKVGRDGGYSLVCEKESVGVDWVTSSVDGLTVTFRAAPPANQTASYTTLFTICVVDNKDGKDYLKTSYKVVTSISKLTGYQLTVAPAEVTVLAGAESKVELKDSVRFEKVYENKRRVAVNNAKLTFSPRASDRITPWMTLNSGGEVTLAPGADVETGNYFCDYRVVADDNGQTETAEGTLTVNIVHDGAPTITTETLPDAEVGTTYSVQMTATGLKPFWTISGTLPEGLSFDMGTGKLSCTPTQVKNYTFDVQATNSAGSTHREFSLKVRNQKPSSWHWARSSKAAKSGSTGTWHATFNVKKGTNVSYYDKSTTKDNLDKDHLKKVIKTKSVKAGEGYIKFNLLWPKTNNKWEEYTYAFKVQAKNNEGISTYEKSFTVAEKTGKLSVAGVSLAADDAITEDDGVETFEPYKDGETPEDDGLDEEGVTYFANGSTDEDGNITAVIGDAASGVEGADFVYETMDKMLETLAASKDNIVSVEFRKGATVDANELSKLNSLPNLEELAIDNCASLTELNLSGKTGLINLSLFDCTALKTLDVSGCSALASLSAMECPKLETLTGVGDCTALESVEVTGAAVTELDLSNRPELANLNLNGCTSLDVLDVTGCKALTDVSLNGTAIPYLDLSECSGLTSLSLADTAKLESLTLPDGASFDNFTLTGSRVGALTLKGTEKLTTLDLSGNAGLTTLALSGCSALSELDMSGCGFEILDLSGCTSLEKLNANECSAMTTLILPGSGAQDVSVSDSATAGKLKELSVGGCAGLRSLNVSGQSLGHLELDGLKWLTRVECDGQFIGGVEMSKSMDLKDYAGNCLYRVSDVQGYAADGSPVETSWNKDTGAVTFASVPESLSYAYDTGLYDNVLGVTVSTSSDPADGPDSPTSNRGGGGCNALSCGLLALAALTGLVARRKK